MESDLSKRSFYSLSALVVLAIFAAGSVDSNTTQSHPPAESNTSTPSATPQPTPPDGTSERVKYEVEKALGKSYRNVARIWDMQITPRSVKVGFSIDDNLTSGMIKGSTKTDVKRILHAVQIARYPFSEITTIGSFPLTDQFGNSKETQVIRATYRRSTVDRINWNGFDRDNIYRIADSVWLHPAFQ